MRGSGFPVRTGPVPARRRKNWHKRDWPGHKMEKREGGKGMAYEEDRLRPGESHQVVLEDRERLTISGVEEVERPRPLRNSTLVMIASEASSPSMEN